MRLLSKRTKGGWGVRARDIRSRMLDLVIFVVEYRRIDRLNEEIELF